MLIDTHAHLDFPDFDNDRGQVIWQTKKAGIGKIVNVGSSLEGAKKSVELAQKYKEIYAAVGVHPHNTWDKENIKEFAEVLRELAKQPKVVAIGECGLDYFQLPEEGNQQSTIKKRQKETFLVQIKLAQELNLPVIIHCRSAQNEILDLLVSYTSISNRPRGVFHCFSGDREFLNQVLKMGFYIGFCGNLTFKNAKNLWEIAKIAPLERILIETDSPFLSPEPYRGLRNTPKNVKLIAEFLAQLRGRNLEEISKITTENAEKLFRI